jgi:TolB-like protein/DNA-binding winged helix-turn-helix (wHTH) protein/Tfp pilus assembly protein PilF
MSSSQTIYEFGPFRIDAMKRLLWRDGQLVQLTSKSLDTLLVLIKHRGQVVTKDDLMKTLWPDTVVEENNLTQQISMLRKVLGEKANEHRYVVTVPGRGYSFVAEVTGDINLIVEQREKKKNDLGPRLSSRDLGIPKHAWRPRVILISSLGLAAIVLFAYGVSWRKAQLSKDGEPNRSIAVLPFKPINSDPANVYLSTGMADALISRLSNLHQISVRPTSTIIKYADQPAAAQVIGRELGVDSVLEGTVQKAGPRVRVTVQLVNVESGTPVWAQTFDQEMTDIFAVQDAISERVAQTMLVRLNGEDQKQIRRRATENVAAYQEYLEGRYFWNARDKDGLTRSLAHFQQAIDLDSNYAQAYSGLADAYTLLVSYRIDSVPRDEAVQRARAAATKALGIDESLAEAHASLAMIKTRYDHDDRGAEIEYRRAIELNPAYATGHHWYSEYLAMNGRETEALSEIKLAQALDPLSPVINTTLGEQLFYARRYDEAIAQLRKTLEISPNFGSAHFILGLALEQKGTMDAAIAELLKAKATAQIGPAADASLGHAYALAGRQREAKKVLHDFLTNKDCEPYEVAMVYQGFGAKQQVLDWLEKIKEREGELGMMLRLDPRLDNLRTEPRFQELLRPRDRNVV